MAKAAIDYDRASRDAKNPPAPPANPTGRKLEGAFGHGSLKPGAGKLVQRTGKPAYCGAIVGRAFGYNEHPNSRDASRVSIRFAGQFIGIRADGTTTTSAESYLPSSIQNSVKAALDVQRGTQLAQPIEFSVEVWCEPDEEGRQPSPLGYRYVCYDRKPQAEADPLLSLAYSSGLLEMPAKAIAAPQSQGEVDPETGEIRNAA